VADLEELEKTTETLLSAVENLTDDRNEGWDRVSIAEQLLDDWLRQSREMLGRLPFKERIDLEELRRQTFVFFGVE